MKRADSTSKQQAVGRSLHPIVRQFVLILGNCESVVIWANNRYSAEVECREKYGEPVHTWATKRQFCTTPAALEKARLFGDQQTSQAACDYKPNNSVSGGAGAPYTPRAGSQED